MSLLGVRPKKTPRKNCLIHDLSYPYDDTSINANITEHQKSVRYTSVCDTIKKMLHLPRGTYTVKCDIRDTYRTIPVHPSEHSKLGICFQGKYYYAKCLAMGCSSACQNFEKFATAVHHKYKYYNPEPNYLHMLDDSFLVQNGTRTCKRDLEHYTELCDDIGVPWESSKTTPPPTPVHTQCSWVGS